MTGIDPTLPISKARSMQFYNLVKSRKTISRWAVIDSMNINAGLFQREYTMYLAKYPQIQYVKRTKEFVFDP